MLLLLLFFAVQAQTEVYNHSGPFPIQNIVIGSGPKAVMPIPANPCMLVRCKVGTFCIVKTDGDRPRAVCEPCPKGQIYKSCPNCMEVRTCGNKDAKFPCLRRCYPPQCVCPPGKYKNPCGTCVPEAKCPGSTAMFHCPLLPVMGPGPGK